MRRALLAGLVMLLGIGTARAVQDAEPRERPLKRGDEVVVEGCLNGTILEGAETGPSHEGAQLPAGLNFQLRGKKDILKQLTSQHDGQLVEVTGIIRSNIDTGATRGRKIGKTRIVIGVRSTTPDRAMMPGSQELLPVLEVKSFESESVNCRR